MKYLLGIMINILTGMIAQIDEDLSNSNNEVSVSYTKKRKKDNESH